MTRNGAQPPVISVDHAQPVPPYEQVRRQIADLIEAGILRTGARLPPVRQLAADLSLATGTVARAYQELETAGLVQTRRGGGTLVAAAHRPTPDRRRALLVGRAYEYAIVARRLAATDDEALEAVRAALRSAAGAPDPSGGRLSEDTDALP